jgi:cytochrome P450
MIVNDSLDRALSSSEMLSNPFPVYARLREEAPVAWSNQWQAWVVSRYEHVEPSLKDKEHLSNENRQGLLFEHLPAQEQQDLSRLRHYFAQKDVIGSDPPDHTRMRSLVQKAFTPKMIASLKPRIEALADELVGAAVAKGEFDFVDDVAHPLPVILIAEMMGAPPQDRHLFKRWSVDILGFQGSGKTQYDTAMVSQQSLTELFDYMTSLVEQRRREPKDDLITALALAEEDGARLSRDELLATCNTILTAGHETTTNLIGNMVRELLLRPHAWREVQDDPSLIAGAVEESLRLDAPKQRNFRRIKRTHDFGGVTLHENQMIFQLIGSANRDPKKFADPDAYDIHRSNAKDHLSLGIGIHFCLGASLARTEASVVLEALIRHVPNLRITDKGYTWQDRQQFRGPGSLWVKG